MTDPNIKDADFIVAANKILRPHLDDGGFEIYSDDDAVSRNEDGGGSDGAFVKVWIWVDNARAEGAYAAEEQDLPMCSCGRDRVMGLATMKCSACWPGHVLVQEES